METALLSKESPIPLDIGGCQRKATTAGGSVGREGLESSWRLLQRILSPRRLTSPESYLSIPVYMLPLVLSYSNLGERIRYVSRWTLWRYSGAVGWASQAPELVTHWTSVMFSGTCQGDLV